MRTFFIALSFAASGCFFTQPSSGELGNVELTYDEGILGCLFGCDADEPMAADSNTFLVVVNDDELASEWGPFVASSENADVLETFQDAPGDSSIRLASHAPGQARVIFEEDASGELIDRFAIDVREIGRIEVSSPEFRESVLVFVGGTITVYLDLFDGSRRLKGFGGVDYELSGGLSEVEVTIVSALADAIISAFVGSTTESVRIEALELGAGGIRVTGMRGGASLDIPVEVVDESRVASVTVSDATAEPGTYTSVSAQAFAANMDEIHSPTCEWTVEGTGVTVSSMTSSSISLTAETETSAQVSCTIGGATGTGTVTFEPYMP